MHDMACPLQSTTFFISGSKISYQVNNLVFVVQNFANNASSRHTIHVLIIPTLLAFLQIQSAGNNNEPSSLEAHPFITVISVLSTLGYYFAFRAKSWFPTYSSLFGTLMGVSGSLSVASLVSLLLPHSWWHLKFIFYVILTVAEMDQILKRILHYKKHSSRMKSAPRLLPLTYLDLLDDSCKSAPCEIPRGPINLFSGVHIYMNNGDGGVGCTF